MHDGHGTHGVCYLFGAASLSGLSAKLGQWGWTPETIVSGLGALSMFVMSVVQFLKAGWPYFDRVTTLLAARAKTTP